MSIHKKTEEVSEMEADDESDDWYASIDDPRVLD